ncbi:hypothetical protein [Pinirhizobacter sp.]|jgi:putative toxin-antitoxin system antitoxin component (TIGR02293 family)|uniref:hypothetical protein n=1 Tax=Pinirhizobacter sp. TaxID=2950432 RepID=UPI002F42E571
MSYTPEMTPSIFTYMGEVLGIRLTSESDAFKAVTKGIATRNYLAISKVLSFPIDLVGPETTIRRRVAKKETFNESESEKIVRVARVYAEAVELFGDRQMAIDWFKRPAEYVRGSAPITPMALAATDAGARIVESHIRRTANGIY